MPTLLAIKGLNVGIKYRLGELTRIGRAPENDIQLADEGVSRVHCEIRRRGRAYTLYDRDSRNGVLVNGQRQAEKLLLRNDEVAIGAAVFLFNSDYDLKSARFSNKMVYLSPPQHETIPLGAVTEADIAAAPSQKSAAEAIQSLSRLFAAAGDSLPDALRGILDILADLFRAPRGCIMLWDEVLRQLTPMVAVSDGEELAVSQQVVKTAFYEKRAILTSGGDVDLRYAAAQPVENGGPVSVMCVPLLIGEKAIGLLYLERPSRDNYSLDDVRLLRAAADLAAAGIDHARKAGAQMLPQGAEAPAVRPFLGASPAFLESMKQIEKAAPHEASVLLIGETGTGKELAAREIHNRSGRAERPFVAVNCAAIPETLFESELFGYERGAFTGAERLTIGKIEAAHGGTLFLDEIGELAPHVQPKLLRFLQDKAFYRVGGTKPITVDVRLVAATNRDLRQAVAAQTFREDLYYRLDVFRIELPPLRRRREDVALLAEHFARRAATGLNKPFLGLTEDAIRALEAYSWPGNVRELENCVERALLLSESGMLGPGQFAYETILAGRTEKTPAMTPESQALRQETLSLREMEKAMIRRALAESHGNQVKAAERLEIHRNTLRKKIEEYGIDLHEFER